MKQKLSQNVTYWLGVVAIGLVVGLSLQFVRAWTEPAVAPPGGNVGAPINTSNLPQQKIAGLAINAGEDTNGDTLIDTWNAIGLFVPNGNVGIGTAAPTQKLDVVGGFVRSDTGFCIKDQCITSWPSGSTICNPQDFSHSQTLNASTTFQIPAGVCEVRVEVWGAGGGAGGGGGGYLSDDQSGGGGGGGGASGYGGGQYSVDPGQIYNVNVGTGGSGGAKGDGSGIALLCPQIISNGGAGKNGGESNFSHPVAGKLIYATGGTGGGGGIKGQNNDPGDGGAGGTGGTSNGNITVVGGGSGISGTTPAIGGSYGGNGGQGGISSKTGSAGNGGAGAADDVPSTAGSVGGFPAAAGGGGGGGAGNHGCFESKGAAGGAGANGRIIIWW